MTRIRDPESEIRTVLFGSESHPAKLTKMAKEIKIPLSTLKRYKRHPSAIPLEKLRKIVRWNNLDAEHIGEIFR